MRIGVPTEIKKQESRVGLTPESVGELARAGHEVAIQDGAGLGSGFSNEDYTAVGARILPDADAVFKDSELIVKVKEPQPEETARLTPDHTLFTYLHLAPDPVQAAGLMKSGCLAIAYETVTDAQGGLPLLRPMSQVAGRMSMQVAAWALMRTKRGPRHPAGRRAGRDAVESGHHRRRRFRHPCSRDRGWHARRRHRLRPQQ